MRWTVRGAEQVSTLRMLLLSDRWQEVAEQCRNAAYTSLTITGPTPTGYGCGIMEPTQLMAWSRAVLVGRARYRARKGGQSCVAFWSCSAWQECWP
jgi:hypothetical protein